MIKFPAQYKGIEDLVPAEMRPKVLELIRRITINTDIATQASDTPQESLDDREAFALHWTA